MLSHQPAKFGGHRHCGIEDTFLVVEEQDSTSPCLKIRHHCLPQKCMHAMLTRGRFAYVSNGGITISVTHVHKNH